MPSRKSRLGFGSVALAIAFLAWTIYTPIPFSLLKIAALGCGCVLFLAIAIGFKYGKWVCLGVALALVLVAIWPAQPLNTAGLRSHYLASLVAYRGTPYVWGGENGRGIDCSGLIRRAMIDALLVSGWENRDPALWREAAFIWWHDCSVQEMKNGYSGRIEPQFEVRSLNQLDTRRLRSGDLAVMRSGVHVLAFLGDQTWIQADPNLANGGDQVIETPAPSRSGWFGQSVVICRWKSLE